MADLKKSLGAGPLIAVGAAGVIGSSFLYLSSEFFAGFGAGGTIIGMLIATFLAACVALAISELTSTFPRAGGELVFAFVAFNRPVGFAVGWTLVGIFVSIVAFYVTAFGFLVSQVVPEMNTIPLYSIGGETVYLPVLVAGLILLVVMLALNWFGAALAFSAQLVMFIAMLVLGLVIAGVGFWNGSFDNFWPMFDPQVTGDAAPVALSISFVLPALGFLTGFSIVAVMSEEAKIPANRVGRIVIISVTVAGLFYTLIFAATAWVIPWQETAGLASGTLDAFRTAGFPVIAIIAFIVGLIGIVTTFLAVFSSVSRLLFSLARAGMLPAFLAKVDPKYRVPRNALLFTAVVGLGLGWMGPGALVWFLNAGGVYVSVVWVFTVASFYTLRRRMPGLDRPYRVRWSWLPLVGGIAGLVLVLVSVIPGTDLSLQNPAEYAILIGWIVLGLILYAVTNKPKDPETSLEALLGDHYPDVVEARRNRTG